MSARGRLRGSPLPGISATVSLMVHPVQSVIESLYAAGRCPRLHVNASHDDVVCPDFIREQWKERLIIDLDANYPLDLTFGEHGLGADLSFGGFITRCEFPWESIYIVADRSTGRGIVLDRNMPESVREMVAKARTEAARKEPEQARKEPALVAVEGSAGDDAEAQPEVADASAAAERVEQTVTDAPAPPPASPVVEEQAKKRRAAFRVIDGGG